MNKVKGVKLPPGWVEAELADATRIVMGQSPPSSTYNRNGQGLPFFQGKAEFGALYPDARVWCTRPSKVAEADDVLLSVRAPVGPTNLAPAKCCIGRGLVAVRPEAGMNLRYLLYAFRRFAGELDAKGTGTTFKAVSGRVVREFPLPIAPTPEQAHIADALDELFSDLDAGVAAVERVRSKLNLYRASALNAAVEGALSGGTRRYPSKPIGSAIDGIEQGWSPKCESHPARNPNKWGVIKTTAIQPLQYVESHNKQLPVSLEPRPHLELKKGDLLITRAGPRSRVGVACLVRDTRSRLMLCDKAYRLRINTAVATPEFLELALNTPQATVALDRLKTGISDSGLNLTQKRFAELRIPLPSLIEQRAIVEAVEDQLSVIEHLERDLDAKLKVAQGLRQSILRQAFMGKLVPQDPKDEPASELLKRIAAEREARAGEAATAKRETRKASSVGAGRRGRPRKEKEKAA